MTRTREFSKYSEGRITAEELKLVLTHLLLLGKVENIKIGRLQNPFHKRKLTLNLLCNPAPSLVMESVDS